MKSGTNALLLLIMLSLLEAGKTLLTARLLGELTSVLKLRGVTLVTDSSLEVSNSKLLFKDGKVKTLKVIKENSSDEYVENMESVIVMMSSNKTEKMRPEWWDQMGYGAPSLLIFDSKFKMLEILNYSTLAINQKVFCFTETEGEILEVYSVDQEVVENLLWTFDNSSSEFIRNANVQEDFILRRSNFHGRQLKVLMDEQAPYLYIDKDNLQDSEFGEEFHKLETDMLSGMFWDLQVNNQIYS